VETLVTSVVVLMVAAVMVLAAVCGLLLFVL
jgi:hypothetical protein